MAGPAEVKLCCLLAGKKCAICSNYFGCCGSTWLAIEENLLCDNCFGIFQPARLDSGLTYKEWVEQYVQNLKKDSSK